METCLQDTPKYRGLGTSTRPTRCEPDLFLPDRPGIVKEVRMTGLAEWVWWLKGV